MLKNWIQTFYRQSIRHGGFTLLNFLGLSVGIASALLAILFIQHELSYDRFHKDAGRIHRLILHIQVGSSDFWATGVPEPLVDAAREVPGVVSTGMKQRSELVLRHNRKLITLENGYTIREGFFDVFTFPLRSGSREAFFDSPGSILLSAETADLLFGDHNPVGEILESSTTDETFVVAGVLQNIPETSHLDISYLTPSPPHAADHAAWRSLGTTVYFKVPPEKSVEEVRETITSVFAAKSTLPDHFIVKNSALQTVPLTGIHLGHISGDSGWVIDNSRLYGVGLLGGVILLLALINYINLTTARGLTRAREVGMRKTLGATRSALIAQFLAESTLMSVGAMALAILLTQIALPHFEHFVDRVFEPAVFRQGWFILSSAGVVVLVGLLSGLLPAMILSAYPSIDVMKGRLVTSRTGRRFRAMLVVGQFMITVGLMGAMTTVHRQLMFMQNLDLGFDQDQVCYLDVREDTGSTPISEIKQRMLRLPGVQAASLSSSAPYCGNLAIAIDFDEETEVPRPYYNVESDEDFVDVFGLTLLSGRVPTAEDIASGANLVLVTEKTVADFDLGPDPIGKMVDSDEGFKVAGVLRDFHANSAQFEQYPVVLTPPERTPEILLLRIGPDLLRTTLRAVEETWGNLVPNQPFEIHFLDEQVDQAYRSERNLSRLVSAFTAVALLVAVMGLYGLSLYTTVLRTKEIGIRRILGASSTNVARLLAAQHLKYVLLAVLIATPATYLLMQKWLEEFAFRIKLGGDIFVLPAAGALLLGVLAVGSHAWRASVANPVDSLRDE
jgi:putative ABC transport system permease protein